MGKPGIKSEYFYRKAKAEDYRARSAFKLIEIDMRFRILKKGQVVVDLGSAPGSWSQVVLEKLRDTGFVLGVDVLHTPHIPGNFEFLMADFTQPYVLEVIESRLPERADVVLCDAAPEFSGVKEVDIGEVNRINLAALRVVDDILKPKGSFVCKTFQSRYLEKLIATLRERFSRVRQFKPKASQQKSPEIYLVALNKRVK